MPRSSLLLRSVRWVGVVLGAAVLAVLALCALAAAVRSCEAPASGNLPSGHETGNMQINDGARAGGQLEPRIDRHT